MRHKNWITALKLEQWADSLPARAVLPQLLRRLVHATIDTSSVQRAEFPSGEGIQRHGIDGATEVATGNAKVPVGRTAWEFGCDANISTKAEGDFAKRATDSESSFIFVTPRKWTRKGDWCAEKRKSGAWRDVRAYDSADLEEWLELAPAVDIWLAHEMGLKPPGVCDLATHWKNLGAMLRLPLAPSLVLTDRNEAVNGLRDFLRGAPASIAIEAPSPAEVVDFIAAWVAGLNEPEQSPVVARAVIVEEREAWRTLAASGYPLILIVGPQLELESELVAEAVRQKHHVIIPASRQVSQRGNRVKLQRMFQSNLNQSLRAAGASDVEAPRIAREAGGNFTILKRMLSQSPTLTTPGWSIGGEASALAPLLLAGGWDDSNDADKTILERLAGRPYAELLALVNRLRVEKDAPVMRVGSSWTFVSRKDSWRLLHWALTSDVLGRFEAIAHEVLSEANPAYELSSDERYLAGVRGKSLKHSPALREGLAETLGLMGVCDEAAEVGDACDLHFHGARVVHRLLDGADWLRWASLASHLPDLAEAAPDDFLQAVENDLRREQPELFKLFAQEGDGFFAGSPHTGLLWALEVMAWDVKLFGRGVLALGRLAANDPGGRLSNRPVNSLRDILLPWLPHTNTTVTDRLAVLARLLKQEPAAGWKLLLALLPKHHDSSSGTYQPKWQSWIGQWNGSVTNKDYRDFVIGVADLLVANASSDFSRWEGLAEHIDELPEVALDRVLAGICSLPREASNNKQRAQLWNLLRAEAKKHRAAQGIQWALPENIVAKLETTVATLTPEDAVERHSWLFASGVLFEVGHHGQEFEEREKLLSDMRVSSVQDVWNSVGLDGLIELTRRANMPWGIGVAAERAQLPITEQMLLPFFTASELPQKQFALGFMGRRFDSRGWEWVRSLQMKGWSKEQAVAFLVILPFQPETWDFVKSFGNEIESLYWGQARSHSVRLSEEQVMFIVSKLREARRPFTVLDVVDGARHGGIKFSEDFLLSVLEDVVLGEEPAAEPAGNGVMFQHHLFELFTQLQASAKTDETRLARLEWVCVKLLDEPSHQPVALHRQLSSDPKFFTEVISHLYRPAAQRGEPKKTDDPTAAKIGERAYHLLKNWARIPGVQPDGSIDATALREWLTKARAECASLDRSEVADIEIGETLAHAPHDVDGKWPCLAVRDAMEELNSEKMFHGFEISISNQRGCYSKSMTEGGAQERELAGKYQKLADSIRSGWPMVAASLQRIADRYLSQAKREDEQLEER